MKLGQFVQDEAGGLARFRGPGDVGFEQLPHLEKGQLAGPIGRLNIVGLTRPDKHDPQTDVDQPRLAEPACGRRTGLVGYGAQKPLEVVERDVGLLDHRHGLAQMTALRCWEQLLAQDTIENDLRQAIAVPLLEADPGCGVAGHIARHLGADLLIDRTAEGQADRDREVRIFGRDAGRDIMIEDFVERRSETLRACRIPFVAVEVARLDREQMHAQNAVLARADRGDIDAILARAARRPRIDREAQFGE